MTSGRWLRLALLAVLSLGMVAAYAVATQASGAQPTRCEQFRADSVTRAGEVTGNGERVVVIGDSWSAGLGLSDSAKSWPSRLPGEVHVAGFSGSGFSAQASPCGKVSFADRAPAVVAGADLLVVEGGLNDWDRSDAVISAGFARLMRTTRAADVERVVVVGPASAPSRASKVPHVDALLAQLAASYGVAYVSTADLDLPYLDDDLHLTPTGHRIFGDAVAARIVALS